MFRFFATLLVTGVAVLVATAWWSGREASDPFAAIAPPRVEAPAAATPPTAPEPEPRAETTPAAKPAAGPPQPERAKPLPAIAAVPAPAPKPRRMPPIPAPPIAELPDPAELAHTVVPEPALPEPIPTPFLEAPPAEEVEETRIPEPAPFRDEVVELAEAERYGEENVIWVEGDAVPFGENVHELFPHLDAEPLEDEVHGERAVAMSGHEASADRIRRLLDVYESLR